MVKGIVMRKLSIMTHSHNALEAHDKWPIPSYKVRNDMTSNLLIFSNIIIIEQNLDRNLLSRPKYLYSLKY